jgi:hypothetical protein
MEQTVSKVKPGNQNYSRLQREIQEHARNLEATSKGMQHNQGILAKVEKYML